MFHVPERSRVTSGPLASDASYGNNGAFLVGSPEPGWELVLICSDGLGWEHVSLRAHRPHDPAASRVPSWREMAFAKDLCWDDDDVVMQLHPRKSQYVNRHPHVLHLWRPTAPDRPIPEPPSTLVG